MTNNGDTLLYLVRHAATDANEQRPYILQGRGINKSLSAIGRAQAAALGRFLSRLPIKAVYSSEMVRAVETATEIASHHGLMPQPVEGLTECHVGKWEGRDWESIRAEYPNEYAAFIDDPCSNPYLGGESYGDVLARVQPVIDQILERHAGEAIAIIAHNVVNRVYLAPLLGIELKRAKDIKQSNTGINVIRRSGGATELLTLNAQFHLHGWAEKHEVRMPKE